MNIPPLPQTDNLYKFCATAGATILVLSILYSVTKRQEVNQRVAEVNAQIGMVKAEAQVLLQHLEAFQRGKYKNDSPEAKQLVKETEGIQLKGAENAGRVGELDTLKAQLTEWGIICLVGACSGGLLLGFGIVAWHLRVQKQQDLLLQRQTTP